MVDFLTSATARRLPQFLLDDRNREENRNKRVEKGKLAQNKKQIANAAFEINQIRNSNLDPEEARSRMAEVAGRFRDNPDIQALVMGAADASETAFNSRVDRKQNLLDKATARTRGETLFSQGQDDRTQSLLDKDTAREQGIIDRPLAISQKEADLEKTIAQTGQADRANLGGSEGQKTFQAKIEKLMKEHKGLSASDATGLIVGTIEAQTNPVDGTTFLLNKITKEKTPFKLPDAPEREEIKLPEDQKLFNLAGLVAGPVSALKSGGSVLSGIVGGPVAEETIQARQFVTTAKNDLIRALSINPRFPVGEIKRIEKEIDIQPKIFDNKKVFQSKLIAIEKFLKRRIDKERSVSDNPNMPVSARQESLKAASDIESFVKLMGIPKSIDKGMAQEEKQAVWDGLAQGESVFVDGVLKVKP